MKVVIDTNVVVSANLSDEGLPAAILDLAASKTILMFVSPAVLAEYEAVLRRPHLNLSPAAVASSLAVIRNISRLVKPTRRLAEAADETDNRPWNSQSPIASSPVICFPLFFETFLNAHSLPNEGVPNDRSPAQPDPDHRYDSR
jgi:putative PIN family toxin of toxin-antitoxin system